MIKLHVGTQREYDILIEKGLLRDCGALTASVKAPCRAMLCCDETVASLYGETVRASYEAAGYQTALFTFAPGERSKNMETLTRLLEAMGAAELDRGGLLVALGGGVAGDLGGLAAALYRRGIDYLQIPTTVLAGVDSSVGGKTAVDLACGKNMAGAFWQPVLVLCDPGTFETLSPETYAGGMAEVVKYGMIFGGRPWELPPAEMVAACCRHKRDIVETDEKEGGRRMLLNFGHTIGHAVELASDYTVPHGQAVAVGMAAMARAAEGRGLAPAGSARELEAVLTKLGLPIATGISIDAVKSAARADKKRGAGGITIVVYDRLLQVTMEQLDRIIEEGLA
ncbi:MAG TPA: 3-dehydroquinate synthase family protein [Terriglobales bacterium]|nr:3-dehydroquinate synthase family protein [Terriglobales bacterium]